MYKRLLLGSVLCLCLGGVQAGHLELEKVSESVFLVLPSTGDSTSQSNAAFVLLPDGILLFDTLSSAELLQEMLELIAKVSDLPINRVVLSHFHPDHTGGLIALRERDLELYVGPTTKESFNRARSTKFSLLQRMEQATEGMARQENDPERAAELRRQSQGHREKLRQIRLMPVLAPSVVVKDRLELKAGDRTLILLHNGPGHSEGDLMLYLPDDKILLSGDVLSVAMLPYMQDADSTAWLLRLDEMAALEVEGFVPGHGGLGDESDLAAFRKFLVTLRQMVEPIARRGTQMDLVEKLRIPAPYDGWAAEDLWFSAALRVFQEMQQEMQAAP